MRRLRSRSVGDGDMVDVILEDEDGNTLDVARGQDEADDEFLAVLHEIALEAIALRAHSPGDPRPEVDPGQQQDPAAADESARTWLIRRLRKRRVVRWP